MRSDLSPQAGRGKAAVPRRFAGRAREPLVPSRVLSLRGNARVALEEGQELASSVVSSMLTSRSRLGPALAGAVLVMSLLLPNPAEAQFGFRGGPLGVARFAVGHVLGLSRLRHARMAVRGGRSRS